MLKIEQLENRETPSYTIAFDGIVRVSGYGVSSTGFVTFNDLEYTPFTDFKGQLNQVYDEKTSVSIVSPLKDGGPRVQVNELTFGNSKEQKATAIFDEFVFEPTFHGGVNVAYGDVNNDNINDLIVAPNEGGGPRVRVFSGSDGFNTVLYDKFVYEPSYRGGINVGVSDGKVLTLPKSGGGPRLRQIDIETNTSTDIFIGDPNSRSDRQLLYGNLLGYEHEYFANYENKILLMYDNNGDLLTKTILPYEVNNIGIGGNGGSVMNRIMTIGFSGNNNLNPNMLLMMDYDPILNTHISNIPLHQPNAYMGIAISDLHYYQELFEHGRLLSVDEEMSKAIDITIPYPNVDPWRNNFGKTVYSGTSIGNIDGTGTLTTTVIDSITNEKYALTNYHVAKPPREVFAPGPADLKQIVTPDLRIGTASKSLGLDFDLSHQNIIDSTLITIDGLRESSSSVLIRQDLAGKPVTIDYKGDITANVGDLVYGFGRTSGPRPGIVQDSNKSVIVDYSRSGPAQLANFENQLYILSTSLPYGFAQPGDSGSIIMKPIFDGFGNVSWYVTAQLFAGNSFFGIAAKWSNIQAMLGIKLNI